MNSLWIAWKTNIQKWVEAGTLDPHLASRATRKNHKHFLGRVFKSRAKIRPATYRHEHMGRKANAQNFNAV